MCVFGGRRVKKVVKLTRKVMRVKMDPMKMVFCANY